MPTATPTAQVFTWLLNAGSEVYFNACQLTDKELEEADNHPEGRGMWTRKPLVCRLGEALGRHAPFSLPTLDRVFWPSLEKMLYEWNYSAHSIDQGDRKAKGALVAKIIREVEAAEGRGPLDEDPNVQAINSVYEEA